jgi:hypothetical protein
VGISVDTAAVFAVFDDVLLGAGLGCDLLG